MKKLVLSLLALPVFAFAQQPSPDVVTIEKSVVCIDAAVLVNELESNKYREVPVWMGTDIESASLWGLITNPVTGTWTIIQFDQDVGCIIGAGTNSGPVLPPAK